MAVKINVAIGPYLKLVKEYQRTQDPEPRKRSRNIKKCSMLPIR